jgi:hypothetical protein
MPYSPTYLQLLNFSNRLKEDIHSRLEARAQARKQCADEGRPQIDEIQEAMEKFETRVAAEPEWAGTDRAQQVMDFLGRCNELEVSRKIRKNDIWRYASHRQPRQFQLWQRGEGTMADEQNFSRILAMQPSEFIAALQKKKLLPT